MDALWRKLMSLANANNKNLSYFSISLLRMTGLWPSADSSFWYLCYTVFAVAWINFYSVQEVLDIVYGEAAADDDATEQICTSLVTWSACLQIFYLLYRLPDMRRYVEGLHSACSFTELIHPDLAQAVYRNESNINKMAVTACGFMFVLSMIWTVLPPVLYGLGVTSEINLPFKAWFPFDLNKGHLFALAYVYIFLFNFYGPTYVGLNIVYIGFISHLCHFIQILAELFENFKRLEGKTDPDKKTTLEDTPHTYGKLPIIPETPETLSHIGMDADGYQIKNFVKLHGIVLDLHKQLESILHPLMLERFSCGVIGICFLGFQSSKDTELGYKTVKYMAMMGMNLLEILMFCFFGEKLITSCVNLERSVYSCPWYQLSTVNRSSIKIILLQSSKHMCITVGKMYIVSMETFKEVLRATYAMFTLLRQSNLQK